MLKELLYGIGTIGSGALAGYGDAMERARREAAARQAYDLQQRALKNKESYYRGRLQNDRDKITSAADQAREDRDLKRTQSEENRKNALKVAGVYAGATLQVPRIRAEEDRMTELGYELSDLQRGVRPEGWDDLAAAKRMRELQQLKVKPIARRPSRPAEPPERRRTKELWLTFRDGLDAWTDEGQAAAAAAAAELRRLGELPSRPGDAASASPGQPKQRRPASRQEKARFHSLPPEAQQAIIQARVARGYEPDEAAARAYFQ
ncbi:MAG TPA: hypothetical protein VD948_02790 [Rhodothermales bacterium]|nr:hypothetical protein [Rhodothermales bacterium]